MNRLALIFAVCLFPLAAARAESGMQPLLRFTSFGLQDARGEYVLAVGDVRTPPFTIPDNGFSTPVPAPGAGNTLALGKPGDTPFRRLATITLPETGKHFLVMVFPGDNGTLRTLVVRADDPAFRPGHVMILNLSSQPLAGDLGGEKLRFEPGKQTIFRPRRKDDLANYQVRFYQAREGKPKVFAASLWPYFDKKRAFVFLHIDPASGSPNYRAIDEFTDWLEETDTSGASLSQPGKPGHEEASAAPALVHGALACLPPTTVSLSQMATSPGHPHRWHASGQSHATLHRHPPHPRGYLASGIQGIAHAVSL